MNCQLVLPGILIFFPSNGKPSPAPKTGCCGPARLGVPNPTSMSKSDRGLPTKPVCFDEASNPEFARQSGFVPDPFEFDEFPPDLLSSPDCFLPEIG